MKSYNKRKGMPSRQQILDYWYPERFDHFGASCEGWDELEKDECWACGNQVRIERCHIVSVDAGGSNTPDNIVLLCHACHVESELLHVDVFWTWLRNVRQTRWKPAIMHTKDRMDTMGLTRERMIEMVQSMGAEKAVNEILRQLGLEKTYHDVTVLYEEARAMVGRAFPEVSP